MKVRATFEIVVDLDFDGNNFINNLDDVDELLRDNMHILTDKVDLDDVAIDDVDLEYL